MAYNVLLKLTCNHLRLLDKVNQTPEVFWCDECHELMGVKDSVDTIALRRADNGRTY